MNFGKKYGWDNIPYREIFLSTGQYIGRIIDGTEIEIDIDDSPSTEN